MILSYLSTRQKNNDSNPHEIILIPFNVQGVLQDKYYSINNLVKYLVQTRSQVKFSGIKLLEVHGIGKSLDPNVQPENKSYNL